MAYQANTNPDESKLCVIAVLDPKAIAGRVEFYVDCNFEIAVERHLSRGEPVLLVLEEWDNVLQAYPIERLAYIRTIKA